MFALIPAIDTRWSRKPRWNCSVNRVGVQSQCRTTALKINDRNTRQIQQTASVIAADLLTADDRDDDSIPLLKPISCGRGGQAPLIIRLPSATRHLPSLTTWPARTRKVLHGATWRCCARTGKPWTCAPAPWPNASCRTACAKRAATINPAQTPFRS